MTADAQRQTTQARFARWAQQLMALQATPFLLIGIGHVDHRFHVFVPHNDAAETALMVDTLRAIADQLEAAGPAVDEPPTETEDATDPMDRRDRLSLCPVWRLRHALVWARDAVL